VPVDDVRRCYWTFTAGAAHTGGAVRYVLTILGGFAINTTVIWLGGERAAFHYPAVQTRAIAVSAARHVPCSATRAFRL
jgi:hypothetical protein